MFVILTENLSKNYLIPLPHLIFYMSMTLFVYLIHHMLLQNMIPSHHNSMSMYNYSYLQSMTYFHLVLVYLALYS